MSLVESLVEGLVLIFECRVLYENVIHILRQVYIQVLHDLVYDDKYRLWARWNRFRLRKWLNAWGLGNLLGDQARLL